MRLACAAMAIAVLGCGDSGPSPATLIDEPRIIAVRAEPPVVALDGATEIDVLAVDAGGRRDDIALSARACSPWRPLLDPDLDCGPGSSLPIRGSSVIVADLLDAFPPPDGALESVAAAAGPPRCEVDVLAVDVPLVIDLAGAETPVIKSVRVAIDGLAGPRTNPSIAALVIDGRAIEPGAEPAVYEPGAAHALTVEIPRGAVDDVCGADDPEVLELERVEVSLYSSAGRFDDRSLGVELGRDGREAIDETIWRPGDVAGEVFVWLVATDGEGGTGWAELRLTDARP